MARPVDFAAVRRELPNFGPRAAVITVTAPGTPHVVTAVVAAGDDDTLRFEVGARTRANLAECPRLTLTWMPEGDGEYQLILDGEVAELGDARADGLSSVVARIDRGILHRLAGLGSGVSCVSIGG